MAYDVDLLEKIVYLTQTSTVEDFPKYLRTTLVNSGRIDDEPYEADLDISRYSEAALLGQLITSIGGSDESQLEIGMSYLDDTSSWLIPEKRIVTGRKSILAVGWQRAGAAAKPSKIQGAQNVEAKDPKHRMGYVLNMIYDEWYQKKNKGAKQDGAYFRWLNTISFFELYSFLINNMNMPERAARKEALAFMQGVTYLNKASRPNVRAKIEKSGLLQYQGAPLDTAAMSTMFSGRGWGIWVMSPKKRFYTNSHQRGIFHHSSFMSGGAVICGGEWKVNKGKIQYITGKTGHYMSDLEALTATLKELVLKGVDLSATQVGMYGKQGAVNLVPAYDMVSDLSVRNGMKAFGDKPLLKVERNVRQRSGLRIGGNRT